MQKFISMVGGVMALGVMLMPTASFAASTAPECLSFIASPTHVVAGETAKIMWVTKNGTRISIEPDIYDSNTASDANTGSVVVKPTKDTKYTLSVYRSGRKDTCSVSVTVAPSSTTSGIIAYTTRDQQGAVTMPITQIPYTGYDASGLLTNIFFLLALGWMLAVGYVLVIQKGSVFGLRARSEGVSEYKGTAIPHAEYRHKVATFISTDQKN